MARPKKEKEFQRSRKIDFRLGDLEYSVIEGYSKAAGMSVSEYVRKQAVYGNVDVYYNIEVHDDDLNAVAKELHGIGNNLNQIAKFFNTGGIVSQAVREDIDKAADALAGIHERMTNWSKDRYGSIKAHRN